MEQTILASARMHEGVSKCVAVVGDKVPGFGQIVFTHFGLEVGEGLEVGLCLASAPLPEEANGDSAQHAQDP